MKAVIDVKPTPKQTWKAPKWTPFTQVPGKDPNYHPPKTEHTLHVPGVVWALLAAVVVLAAFRRGAPFLARGGGVLTRKQQLGLGGGGRLRIGPSRGETLFHTMVRRVDTIAFLAANAVFLVALVLNTRT